MLKQIKKQVADVISHSQCFDDPAVDGLIDTWLEAKRDFIEGPLCEITVWCER